jgi:hypothetical protein
VIKLHHLFEKWILAGAIVRDRACQDSFVDLSARLADGPEGATEVIWKVRVR